MLCGSSGCFPPVITNAPDLLGSRDRGEGFVSTTEPKKPGLEAKDSRMSEKIFVCFDSHYLVSKLARFSRGSAATPDPLILILSVQQ